MDKKVLSEFKNPTTSESVRLDKIDTKFKGISDSRAYHRRYNDKKSSINSKKIRLKFVNILSYKMVASQYL